MVVQHAQFAEAKNSVFVLDLTSKEAEQDGGVSAAPRVSHL